MHESKESNLQIVVHVLMWLGYGSSQMASGHYHNCGVEWSGRARCWGWNNAGQAPSVVSGDFVQVRENGTVVARYQ